MQYPKSLTDKAVVVTGAFGTLGAAIARLFLARGARVGLLDRAPVPQELAAALGASHCLGGVDLTQSEPVAAALHTLVGSLGKLDVLVNVAGGFRWQTLEQGELSVWDTLYEMNLKTAVVTTRSALPALLRSSCGRVINIGAGAASRSAAAGMGAYTASKAGVHKLTESLAEELKDRGITVNAVLPGIIDTPQNRADMPTADFSRWVSGDAIAEVVAFLASAESAAITGALIPVVGRG